MSSVDKTKTVGEIIAEARKKSGLTLRAVADRIDIVFSYLSDIEKGRRIPSETVIKAICEQPELDLDFDVLMARSGRFGEESETHLRHHPALGKLVRNISQKKLDDQQIESLNEDVDKVKS